MTLVICYLILNFLTCLKDRFIPSPLSQLMARWKFHILSSDSCICNHGFQILRFSNTAPLKRLHLFLKQIIQNKIIFLSFWFVGTCVRKIYILTKPSVFVLLCYLLFCFSIYSHFLCQPSAPSINSLISVYLKSNHHVLRASPLEVELLRMMGYWEQPSVTEGTSVHQSFAKFCTCHIVSDEFLRKEGEDQ